MEMVWNSMQGSIKLRNASNCISEAIFKAMIRRITDWKTADNTTCIGGRIQQAAQVRSSHANKRNSQGFSTLVYISSTLACVLDYAPAAPAADYNKEVTKSCLTLLNILIKTIMQWQQPSLQIQQHHSHLWQL